MTKGKKPVLKNKIFNEVLKDIIKGEYPPEDIINEKDLIQKYGVSKSPVRDALTVLCNEGVLKSIPRYGYQVVKVTTKDINDIIEYRLMIEGQGVKKIIENATEEDKESLKLFLERCREEPAEADILIHWEKNTQFHLELNRYAKNQYIYTQLEKSLNTLMRAYGQFHWDKWHKTEFIMGNNNHVMLLEQIIIGDFEKAYERLRQDVSYFRDLASE